MKISKEQIQKIFSNLEFINKIMDSNVPAAECEKYFYNEGVEISKNELEEVKKLMVAINQIDPEKINEKDLTDIAGGGSNKTDVAFTVATGTQLAAMVGLGIGSAISAFTDHDKLTKKLGLAALALGGTSAMTGIAWGTARTANLFLNNDSKNKSQKNLEQKN